MSVIKKCLYPFFATLIIFAIPSYAASTVQQAAKEAIEKNPEVLAKWYEFLAAGDDVNSARAGYKPSIDGTLGLQYQKQNYGLVREYDGAYARLTLTQMLYDGSRTRSEVNRFSNFQLVAYFNLLETAENIALEAFRAYQDVLAQRQLVALAQENLDKHFEVYRQIESSAKAGVAKFVDLEQISGRVSLAQSNVITETSNLHDVTTRYLRIVGALPSSDMRPVTLSDQLPSTVNQALRQAYQASPAYHAALRNIKAAEAGVQTQKANFKPNVNLVGSYGYQNYSDIGVRTDQNEASVGIELKYNFYNGGRNSASLSRAYSEVNLAEELRDKACIDIRQTIQIAYNDGVKLAEQLPLLNQHRLSSDKVRTAYKQQFDIGQRSLLDVLDSENEYFQASRAYLAAIYTLSVAKARTLAGMGNLTNTLGLNSSTWPSLTELGAERLTVDPATACPAVDVYGSLQVDKDTDNDSVKDSADFCPNTPITDKVDAKGCSVFTQKEAKFTLEITFGHNQSVIEEQYLPQVASFAAFLQRYPNTKAEIQGHTSSDGAAWYNDILSQQRADAVKQILVSQHGIAEERIMTKGYGASRLLAEADTEAAHNVNRRIEAVVTAKYDSAVPRAAE
ncbi:TolC family outer membrane protein [Rheinheimera sp. UJ63]|uniref:TolC family outer membrane protein n=1 Tax=Rheinheimera sp. UJ63 TaxID=2910157 RepID=UPI001F1F3684|nr:TolC family outer membrane protein [Rheinheimera sp. UJ63]MCF4010552.1 TolC family outer membrane protein [Rheinheimera sp. UJ63]